MRKRQKAASEPALYTKDNRLTAKQVSAEYGICISTLANWRQNRLTDPRYPRYHKLFTGRVYYIRAEFEEDFAAMHIETELKMPKGRRRQ